MRSEGYCSWSVCLCVSVTSFSAVMRYNAHKKTYHQLQWDMRKVLNLALYLWHEKAQYANEYLLTETLSGADAAIFCLIFRRKSLLKLLQSLAGG